MARALRERDGAPWVEPAAGRYCGAIRDLPGQRGGLHVLGDRAGHGGDQRPGVGMAGGADDLLGRAEFDDPAQVHHRDAIRVMSSGGQVVSDHHDSHRQGAAKVVEHLKYLRPDRDIQHGDWLVRNNDHGLDYQRGGYRYALALTSGKLMRKSVEVELGRVKPDLRECLGGELAALATPPADPVDP